MLFAIGTKVRFRFTGERGTITARLDDEMLQVRLDSDPDLEIPTFEEDLVRDSDYEPSSAGAKFVLGKQEKKPEPPPRREIKGQYLILKPKGLQLCFEPMPGRDGSVTRYKAWLVNDTLQELLLEFDLFTGAKDLIFVESKIGGTTALELGDILYDDLNETPEAIVTIRRLTTAGQDEPLERNLKIRAKQFFNNLQTSPILNLLTHNFLLFDSFEPTQQDSAETDLKDYAKQNLRKPRADRSPASSQYKAFNVEEFASFIPEIDLHIETLVNGRASLDKSEILRIQMQHFQRFMEKAVRLGVPNVFIIHGVGEGKLRDTIAERLRNHPDVVKFKNEYHPKYGYGATEVWL